MKIFIDTADTNEIKTVSDLGLIDGVTTNPTLSSKTGKDYKELVYEIFQILPLDSVINLEVIATDYEGILAQGRALSKLDPRVHVKVPCIKEGLKAVKTFNQEGIKTNVTLVFSPLQALIAAKMGATFISPFIGRLDDISEDGVGIISQIVQIMKNYNYQSKVLFASVRSVEHVRMAALIGVDIITCPFEILMEMYNHPLTDAGLTKFLEDWKQSGSKFIAE